MVRKYSEVIQRTEKEFLDIFKTLCYSRASWQVWSTRRLLVKLKAMSGTVTTKKTVEKEHYYMFFDFDKKESNYGEH